VTVNLLLPPFHLRQVEVRGDIESDIHNHVLRHRVKVRSLRHDHVSARRQFRQDVTAVGVGDYLASQAGCSWLLPLPPVITLPLGSTT